MQSALLVISTLYAELLNIAFYRTATSDYACSLPTGKKDLFHRSRWTAEQLNSNAIILKCRTSGNLRKSKSSSHHFLMISKVNSNFSYTRFVLKPEEHFSLLFKTSHLEKAARHFKEILNTKKPTPLCKSSLTSF